MYTRKVCVKSKGVLQKSGKFLVTKNEVCERWKEYYKEPIENGEDTAIVFLIHLLSAHWDSYWYSAIRSKER